MPQVSIIVPTYNAARFISETIASIRCQTDTDWELILVDDGSSDSTREILAAEAASEKRLRVIHKENEGTCRTRNRGFQESSPGAPYLFFLDHDDLIEPRFLEVMCGHLDTHSNVGLVACHYEEISADSQRLRSFGPTRVRPGLLAPRTMGPHEIETPFATFFCRTGRGPFAVYRRSVYERTTGWETAFWPDEDTDMFCQMALLAPVHFLPDRLYLKRVIVGQGSGNWDLVWNGYHAFRAKWDGREPTSPREQALLQKAKDFYYRRYRPWNHLLGAARALRRLGRTGRLRECGAMLQDLRDAVHCFLSPPVISRDGLIPASKPWRPERK